MYFIMYFIQWKFINTDIWATRVLGADCMQNFRAHGPVVQTWISANPGLKFNPLFKFVYFCISVYYENRETVNIATRNCKRNETFDNSKFNFR